jgi:hypothetical protein
MAMNNRLLRPRVSGDPDALRYIAAVQAADGQSLEAGVKKAISDFVVGCKADGIWTAIETCCIFAGARTLSGALTPLVGVSPTNVNFVSGDYDRKTGLVGNGSNKRVRSGYVNKADHQNNRHDAVFVQSASTLHLSRYYSSTTTNPSNQMVVNTTTNQLNVRSFTGGDWSVNTAAATGLLGVSRASSNFYLIRANGATITTVNQVAGAPGAVELSWFAAAAGTSFSNGRLQFASAGYALDLALLEARVSTLITAIGAAIP